MSECVHHYIFPAPNGAKKIKGACKHCGATQEAHAFFTEAVPKAMAKGMAVAREHRSAIAAARRERLAPEIVELWDEGLTVTAISELLGAGHTVISRVLKEASE